jgi:predicted dehydrogenase
VAVIGIGFGQAVHVPAFRAVPGCEVVGIAASEASRAREVADRSGLAMSFGGWEDAVACPAVDLITVAVPPDMQPGIVEAAVARGKHVLCEKPLAADLASAERAVAAARSRGVRHAIDLEFPELPAWRALHDAVRSGDLGAVEEVRIEWRVPAAQRPPRSAWKDQDDRGGGLAGGSLPHVLHHVEWLGGRLSSVRAVVARDGQGVVRSVAVTGRFASGASAMLRAAREAGGESRHRISVRGELGEAVLENLGTRYGGPFELVIGGPRPRRVTEVALPDADSRLAPVTSLAARLVRSIQAGTAFSPDLSDGLRVQTLLDALDRSADLDREIIV